MRLFIEIIQGPEAGKQINLTESATIGRKGADFILNDGKLSGIHGVFKFDPKEGWLLLDNGSRNGIWVKGIREHRILIKDDLEIQMGQTIFRCRIIVKSSKKVEGGFVKWLEGLIKNVKNQELKLKEIKPEMRLKVTQGLQYGQTWDVFFGPRIVGKEQLDICLYDDKAPEDAFEILVKGRYPYFHTKHSSLVKLNGETITDKQLAPGDVIEVGDSKILIEFDSGHGFSS